MLYLGKEDIKEIAVFHEIVEKVEEALLLYAAGDFMLPDRISEHYNENNFIYMPFYSDNIMGTKVVTLFPDNPKNNIPVLNGVMLLNDTKSGKIKCIIDGASITSYRTGAVGATGVKYTSPDDINSLGMVGCGVQGYYQIMSTLSIRDIKTVTIFDINHDSMKRLMDRIKKEAPNVEVVMANSVEELVENSQAIITATTSTTPFIPNDIEMIRNKHFVAIGSYKPEMREYTQSIFSLIDKLYVDTEFAKQESGDIIHPLKENWINENQIVPISSLLTNKDMDIVKKTTLFKSVGMAIFDVVVAEHFYNKALKMNIGTKLD